ncbi:MAG: PepSY-like domain-containing protein [Cyclobacteriaceae bacterium]
MKKTLLVLMAGLLVCAFQTMAQENEIPEAVSAALQAKYSNAENVEWHAKKDKFKAAFNVKGKKMNAVFSSSGEWMKTYKHLSVEELPATITAYVSEQLEGYEITSAYIMKDPEGKSYSIKASKGEEIVKLAFDIEGNFLSKET